MPVEAHLPRKHADVAVCTPRPAESTKRATSYANLSEALQTFSAMQGFSTKDKCRNLWTDNNIVDKELVSDSTEERPDFDLPGNGALRSAGSVFSVQGYRTTSTKRVSKTAQHVTAVTQIRLYITL